MSKGLSFSNLCCSPLVEAASPSETLHKAQIQSSRAIPLLTPTHTAPNFGCHQRHAYFCKRHRL